MSDNEFYTKILEIMDHVKEELSEVKNAVARTEVEIVGINRRLDQLNGTVAKHTVEIGVLQTGVAERKNQCPVAERVVDGMAARLDALETKEVEKTTAVKVSNVWLKGIVAGAVCMSSLIGWVLVFFKESLFQH